jgi:hypothetical protein
LVEYFEVSRDYPHQTPKFPLILKVYLVLVYWDNLILTYPHFSPNFSVFLPIFNILSLPSRYGLGISGDWVKIGVHPIPLGIIPTNPLKYSRPNKVSRGMAEMARDGAVEEGSGGGKP